MKKKSTIKKINSLLGVSDYRGMPRGTIAKIGSDGDNYRDAINYLIRHGIIILSGDRYIYCY